MNSQEYHSQLWKEIIFQGCIITHTTSEVAEESSVRTPQPTKTGRVPSQETAWQLVCIPLYHPRSLFVPRPPILLSGSSSLWYRRNRRAPFVDSWVDRCLGASTGSSRLGLITFRLNSSTSKSKSHTTLVISYPLPDSDDDPNIMHPEATKCSNFEPGSRRLDSYRTSRTGSTDISGLPSDNSNLS
ncbi:hypothetical protein FOZ63_012482 [Perkinsus olseni]|uniref:Uncharacterized protein n=1 Tax=Perkinsus olseni TaxID=32597 RepID=A0A7J6U3H3_PEROL|nr:hypothetical protein FOZ63_012482 [Perkinsus olseni]